MSEEINDNQEKVSKGFFKEIIKFVLIAFLIVVPFRWFIAQPFIVNGASMIPAFESGEYLIVDQLSYRIKDPQRGEILIFKYPKDPSKYFIKRVIGLPGETVEITGQDIKIFNDDFPEGFLIEEDYIIYHKNNNLKTKLEDDEYFVMGDNRASSSDSRIWGPLKREMVVGKPLLRLYPLKRLQFLPGDHEI